jgi:hypothetical protein
MKKVYLSLIAVLSVCQITYAQWTTNSANTVTSTPNSVGIGTTNPQAPLDVATLLNPGTLSAVLGHLPEGNSQGGGTYLGIKVYNTQLSGNITNISNVVSFAIEHSFYGATNSSINFFRGDNTSGGSMSFNTNNNNEVMRLLYNGNVGIGTTTPDQKLTVKGTIHSQVVIVDNNITPDYVFKSDYKLASLKDVKAYIEKNHHLPEIPSAKTVAKRGLNLGAMNTLLLKKVEELTLYTIASDKEIKDEKAVIKAQQAQIDLLINQVAKLSNEKNK